MSAVISNEKIPNNVGLSEDRRLQRALEKWLPNYIDWWKEMGPEGYQENNIFLRTAISVDRDGWANFDYVKMPDYRWGIFLADAVPDRKIGFGDHANEMAWQQVPGEYRNMLRNLIVTQGDTEPASVEQQRLLGNTAPSLYDMRNLFQVNVEEGRHMWAMVYLLHTYFGRDGREEADEMLQRRSGDEDKPRILGAFNEPMPDWLQFFLFTMFTDRDGKYQLLSLAESGFDPLARTCKFMLTEEAHHMFVGETGIARIVQRTCELMKQDKNEDAIAQGGISLDMLQRGINQWYALSADLFGSEISSNAASYFASGVKGRAYEMKKYDEHLVMDSALTIQNVKNGKLVNEEIPMRNALNEVLREEFREDDQRAVDRWNKILQKEGIEFELKLPDRKFHRQVGIYADHHFDPTGKMIDEDTWKANESSWLLGQPDLEYMQSIQVQVTEPGKFANWIAPPRTGIKGRPLDYEYVRL